MKDYKLLLAGLILLLLVIFIVIFTWLWSSNRKNMDPLPILTSESETMAGATDENVDASSNHALYLQIEDSLKIPLDHVIASFEARYPHVQVVTNYVASTAILTLADVNHSNHKIDNESTPVITNTDIIITDNVLPAEQLLRLETKLKATQDKRNQSKVKADSLNANEVFSEADVATDTTDNTETRRLNAFSYALKDEHALEGVILTHNPVAISFRNFLLSSTGQDILKNHDYYNIDGYQNSVNDLFNPTSRAKEASGDTSVDITDALSNGE